MSSSTPTFSFENSRGRVITTSDPTKANQYRNDPGFTEVTEGATDESPYAGTSVKDLKAEVERRNADRDPEGDAYISVEAPGNKPQLIAALTTDDNAPASNPDSTTVSPPPGD